MPVPPPPATVAQRGRARQTFSCAREKRVHPVLQAGDGQIDTIGANKNARYYDFAKLLMGSENATDPRNRRCRPLAVLPHITSQVVRGDWGEVALTSTLQTSLGSATQ